METFGNTSFPVTNVGENALKLGGCATEIKIIAIWVN